MKGHSDKPEPYEYVAHEFIHRQGGKVYCTHCGLYKLNNEFTDWAVRMGCNSKLHPSYANKRYDLTKLKF